MKQIAKVLILLILVVVLLLILFKVAFDQNFIANLLNGLLTNVIILIVAIFVIDRLIKKVEVKKLEDINKRNSDFFSTQINIFILVILEYLKILKEEDRVKDDVLEKNRDLTFEYVWQELETISSTKNIDQILFDLTINDADKKKFLIKFVDLLKKHTGGLYETIKNVYPHPSSDLTSVLDQISEKSGIIGAMSNMANIAEEVNKILPKSNKKMDKETADALLKFFMISNIKTGRPLSIIVSNLKTLSERAKDNNLFVK